MHTINTICTAGYYLKSVGGWICEGCEYVNSTVMSAVVLLWEWGDQWGESLGDETLPEPAAAGAEAAVLPDR